MVYNKKCVTNIFHISFKKLKKVLDFPLTIMYTLYVDWLRIKLHMTKDIDTLHRSMMLPYHRKDGPVFDSYAEHCSETAEEPTADGYKHWWSVTVLGMMNEALGTDTAQ